MNELPQTPVRRVLCPDGCRYRNKIVPFCGYCMIDVMKKSSIDENRKEKDNGREEDSGNRPQ